MHTAHRVLVRLSVLTAPLLVTMFFIGPVKPSQAAGCALPNGVVFYTSPS